MDSLSENKKYSNFMYKSEFKRSSKDKCTISDLSSKCETKKKAKTKMIFFHVDRQKLLNFHTLKKIFRPNI